MTDLVEKVLDVDPVVDLDYDYKPDDIITKGCTEKTVYPIGASNFTDSNIGFQNISPASLTTVTEREFRVKYTLFTAVSFPIDTALGGNYPYTPAIVGTNVNRAFPVANTAPPFPALPAYVPGQLAVDPAGSDNAGHLTGDSRTTFCLRSFPLQSSLSSLELFLNGQSLSIPQNDLICLQQYIMSDEENQYAATYPVQRENSALYKSPMQSSYATAGSAGGNVGYVPFGYNDSTDLRNPMSMNTMNTTLQSRASHLPTLVYEAVAAGVCYRVYRYDLCESLVISPLVWGKCYDAEGLANIVNISMNLTVQSLNRSFSRVPGLLGASTFQAHLSSFNINGVPINAVQPQFIPLYLSQDPVLSARQGSNIFYDYDRLLVDANSNAIAGSLTAGSEDGTWEGNALRSNIIPDEILVYIKPRKGTIDETVPDNFLRIKKLNVSIGNRANVFASFTEEDLFRMSNKNGVKLSLHEWKYTVGSIIKISVPKDIGLVSDEASGQTKFTMIKIDGTYSCSNLTYSQAVGNIKYDVMTVLVTSGKAIVSPGTVQLSVGGVNASDVLMLTSDKTNVVASGMHHKLSTSRGGNLFNKTGRLLKKGLSFLKNNATAENANKLANAVDTVSSGMDMIGLGGNVSAGSVAGGKLVRSKHKRVL